MTILVTTTSTTASGGVTNYPFTFRILEDTDLEVYVDGVLQTLTTDYTVTFTDGVEGGTVVFGVAPAGGTTVLIKRVSPKTQETDFPFGKVDTEALETALDKAAMLSQEVAANIPSYKWQDKLVSSNVTSDGVFMTFNNLETGKTYRVEPNLSVSLNILDSEIDVSFVHDSTTILGYRVSNIPDGGIYRTYLQGSKIFTATATTLTVEATGASASAVVTKDNTASNVSSFVRLTEVVGFTETTDFT